MASGSRSHRIHDYHDSGGSDRDNMEDEDDANSHHPSRQSRFVELNSPLKSQAGNDGTNQGGYTEQRPQAPPGPGDHGSKVPEGIETFKSHSKPFEGIVDSRKRKANTEVYNAFIGHSKKCDTSQVKLKETGWAMAKRVFHPPEAERWLLNRLIPDPNS